MIFNRNLHVAVLIAAMLALGARASIVTSNEVVDAVSAWASANGAAFNSQASTRNSQPVATSAAPTYDDDGATVLYWTVTMSNGGAVIASPDSDLDLVVAVLEKYDGPLPAGHPLLSMLKTDLSNRLAVLAKRNAATVGGGRRMLAAATAAPQAVVSEKVEEAVAAANAQWAKYGVGSVGGGMRLMAAELTDGDESPYVRRIVPGFETKGRYTFWNQSSLGGGRAQCFNAQTPLHAVCGCVATAGSAILHFFNCTNDPGVVTSTDASINGARNGFSTIAGDTDWSILPENLVAGTSGFAEPDDAGYELLGRVAYNLGVLVDMEWTTTPEGSGSQTRKLAEAFKTYGFKTARYVAYSASENTDGKEFLKTLYAQLWCGAPAVLSIHGAPGGHAVVACGYARDNDGDEFCRVFMGWGGSGDAWYKFPKIEDFSQVNGAVTMIGYEDDAVVPVYGEANIPGIELTVPGYKTNDVPVTALVDEHGYFGVRVPISLEASQRYIEYTDRGKRFDIAPFNDSVLGDESASQSKLDEAIPDEMLLMILNMDSRTSAATGRAVASRDGKALLLVSGTSGSDRTVALLNYLYHLDEVTDISNKFVMVFTTAATSDGDGDPSIGVFDPDIGSADLRWWLMNGRLAYTNFIVSADSETGDIIYEITADDTSAVTNALPVLLEDGYTAYLRNHSDAVVTVTGVDLDSGSSAPFEIAVPTPAYGVASNAWTNCESVVFSAPGTFTNEAEGVIYSCVGWATNTVFSGPNGEAVYNPGRKKKLKLSPGDNVTFTWVWQKTHFRVTAKPGSLPSPLLVGSSQYVTPTNVWCAVNDRVTIYAQASVGEAYKLWEWKGASKKIDDYFGVYNGETNPTNAMKSVNGSACSFTVYEPVEITANYSNKKGLATPSDPTARTVTVTSEPEDVAEFASLSGSLTWGENTICDSIIHLAPGAGSYIDATGGVWACTGWIVEGESMPEESLDLELLGSSLNVVSVWEHQGTAKPEDSDDDDEPTPGPISITALEQTTSSSWVITVTGAVKGCWYWLYETDDLADYAGDEATWKAVAGPAATDEDNPQQAAADGDIVFHVTTGADAQLFWRVRATSTEDDD